jgi:hypothetical protein
MFVRLNPNRVDVFRRCVRDENRKIISVLEFSPQDKTPMEITDPLELEAIQKDIGFALLKTNPPVAKPDKPKAAAAKPIEKPPVVKADPKPAAKAASDPLKV